QQPGPYYILLGRAYLLRATLSPTPEEEFEKAFAACETALSDNTNDLDALLIQAAIHNHQGKSEAALALYEKILTIQSNPLIYNDRGEAYFAAGRYAEALADFEHCEAKMPNYYQPVAGR